jgi:hypothetical protein
MPNISRTFLLSLVLLVGCGSDEPPPADPEAPSFDDVVAKSEAYEGVVSYYRDKESGELFMALDPEQLDRDFLYFATFLDGNGLTGTQRGVFASQRVIRFHKRFKKLEFQQVNTRFWFDPDSALSRAAEANIPPTVLAVADIVDEKDSGEIMVKVSPVFLSEALQQIKPAQDPKAEPGTAFALGALSEDKTALREVRAYPENVDLIVNYVYEDPAPVVAGTSSMSDDRFVSIVMQHTLIAAPEEPFEPRLEDPRVGYFTDSVTDMTSHEATPWRDPITRWKLVKKDPDAELSEPVEPIVFWLENTTPAEHLDVVRDAVLTWNRAFESAGFKNAVVVKIQPDDADWDSADLRYNVLRWTSSDESGWGGYGPSWNDPRTGQILGADIMLEFGWITSYLRRDRVFAEALLPGRKKRPASARLCQAGKFKQHQLMLARSLLNAKPGSATESELVRQSLYDLVTHEVGHTLGLNHNFQASTMLSPDQLYSQETTEKRGVASSVMDYLAVNVAPPGQEQGLYFPVEPGVYDHWVIEFGYSEALADPEAEQARLEAILVRSTEPELGFGLDADAMYSSESGIDPRNMMFDQSSDPLAFAADQVALVEATGAQLLTRFERPGASWQELYNAYLLLTGEVARVGVVASRWIGGVYVDRAMQGQAGATEPLRPVPLARQQQAMALLNDKIFAPGALQFSPELYRHLQRQRRGQNLWYTPQDPVLHARILNTQRGVLDHLLHPVVMARISDSALYGNEYSLTAVVEDLTDAVFAADMDGNVNSVRQQLQREYIERLLVIADPAAGSAHDYLSRSVALYTLQGLERELKAKQAGNEATRVHTAALVHRIEGGLYPGNR